MKHSQQSRLNALHLTKAFLDENADALGSVNKSTSRLALNDAVTTLDDGAQAQVAAELQAASTTLEKTAIREDLRMHHMHPVAAIARATLAHVPTIADLRLPAKTVNDATLIARGTAMANVAAQYSDVFIAEQLPADFLAQLRAAVDSVRSAVNRRDLFQVKATQATRDVDVQLARAHNIVKILDSLVVKQLKDRPDLLAGWRRAKHPKAKPGVPRGTTASAPPTVAVPAEPAPAVPAPAVPAPAAQTPAAPETIAITAPVGAPFPSPVSPEEVSQPVTT
jgi:hypothetical protein